MKKKEKKIRLTLGNKLLCLMLALCVLLCGCAFAGIFAVLQANTLDNGETVGRGAAAQIGEQVTPSLLDSWAAAEEQASYQMLMDDLQQTLTQIGTGRLLVLQYKDGTWLHVAGVDTGSNGKMPQIGAPAALSGAQKEWLFVLQSGSKSTSLKGNGQVATFSAVRTGDGALVGCVLCEVDLTAQLAQNIALLRSFALVMGVAVLVAVLLYVLWVKRLVTRPIQQLSDAVQAYEGGENRESLRKLTLKNSPELQSIADAFRMMLVEIDLRGFEERELAVREERIEAELKLTTAINNTMQPKPLPVEENPAFAVYGLSDKTGELHCDFYDYFLLEDGRLCLVIGSVPNEGVSAALYMVIAKTTIKNQLRVGLPLEEAIAETNRQLYEVGQGMVVNTFVGILDKNGVLSFVCAGQEAPLLMRAQDRYEWLKVQGCSSLGQNENLTCPEQKLQLFQGDRLFFHTAGLSRIVGEDGSTFGDHQLQAMLNRSRTKQLSVEQLLEYMQGEGKAFAANVRKCSGFSMLTLEYLHRRKDLAHCVVERDREGAQTITDFLKRQLSENGFSRRDTAQLAVLADEVFALCCRQRTQGLVMVECEIAPRADSVTLRLKSAFDGSNPLERYGGEAEPAVAFIRKNIQESTFQKGELQDVLTLVWQSAADQE